MVPRLSTRWVGMIGLGALASGLAAASILISLGSKQPLWGLVAAAAGFVAVYRPDLVVLATVPVAILGVNWPLGRLAALAMVAAAGYGLLLCRRPRRSSQLLAYGLVLIFVTALVASCVWPQVIDKPQRHFGLVTLLGGVAVFCVCIGARLSAKWLAIVVAMAGGLTAMIVLTLGRVDPDLATWDRGRLWALGQNPNGLALLVSLPLIAAVGLAWRRREPLWLLPALPCALTIWLTESRGAVLAVACGLAYLFLVGRRWWWQTGGIIAAGSLAMALCQVFFTAASPAVAPPAAVSSPAPASQAAQPPQEPPPTIRVIPAPQKTKEVVVPAAGSPGEPVGVGGSRKAKDLEHNNAVRIRVARFAVEVALRHPIMGIGYGGFATFAKAAPEFALYMNTHNEYLRLAAESGFLALISFGALLWLGLRRRGNSDLATDRKSVV